MTIVLKCGCRIENAERVVYNLGLKSVFDLVGRLVYCYHHMREEVVDRIE